MPCYADKTTPPGGDNWYGNPPSKYIPTRRAYGPTHYRMGHTTVTLTFKANQANKDLDPTARDRGRRLYDQQGNQYSLTVATTPLGGQETMAKATASPRHIVQLANHRHANSAVTTGTVAPRHATPRHGEQDHDDHDDDHA